jgi:lysophospholipase L1-like esterase
MSGAGGRGASASGRRGASHAVLLALGLCALSGCRLVGADPHVAFLGDSITQGWYYPRSNYGRYGNTTAQMLVRLPAVLSSGRYKEVIVLGGTNDILKGIGPEETIHNLEMLGEQIDQRGAEPVLCEIPPIFHALDPANSTDYAPAVIQLNRRIAELASLHHWRLIDYYSPLAHHASYSRDGVHLGMRGYLLMETAFLRQSGAGPAGESMKPADAKPHEK